MRFKGQTLDGRFMLNDPEGKINGHPFIPEIIRAFVSTIRSQQIPELSSHSHPINCQTAQHTQREREGRKKEGEKRAIIFFLPLWSLWILPNLLQLLYMDSFYHPPPLWATLSWPQAHLLAQKTVHLFFSFFFECYMCSLNFVKLINPILLTDRYFFLMEI